MGKNVKYSTVGSALFMNKIMFTDKFIDYYLFASRNIGMFTKI